MVDPQDDGNCAEDEEMGESAQHMGIRLLGMEKALTT